MSEEKLATQHTKCLPNTDFNVSLFYAQFFPLIQNVAGFIFFPNFSGFDIKSLLGEARESRVKRLWMRDQIKAF